MSGFRRHGRKAIKVPVKLSHDGAGDFVVETVDVSETGLFVSNENGAGTPGDRVVVGDTMNAEVANSEISNSETAIPETAKAENAIDAGADVTNATLKVVRKTYDGFGLEFS